MGEWLIPFRDRGRSSALNVNVVWKSGSVYVMDNHRVALWCWLQHLADAPRWNLLHIDRHYDCLGWGWEIAKDTATALPTFAGSLRGFLDAEFKAPHGSGMLHHVQWDNYLPVLWEAHGGRLNRLVFATAKAGDPPRLPPERVEELAPHEVPSCMDEIGARWSLPEQYPDRAPWVVNIDADYFTLEERGEDPNVPLFHDDYIDRLGRCLKRGIDAGWIGVLTIALSPETTLDWAEAERIVARLMAMFSDRPDFGEP